MTRPLQVASIAAPSIKGLNTQTSSGNLEDGFALKANNCIIDKFGRLGSRKGWVTTTTQKDSGGANSANNINILGMHHFIDFEGAKTVISWTRTKFYVGLTNLVELAVENTTNDEDLTPAAHTGNWMAATLNDLAYFFQEGYLPLVYDPTGNSNAGSLTTLKDFSGHSGTTPSAGFVMSAFGRIWATHTTDNVTKIHFSDVNDGRHWTGGTSGVLDITSVFPKGTDVITGLATQNGALVILCRNSIVVYDDQVGGFNGTLTVANLTLTDIIYGVGCIAAKTIVNTGEDVLFLDSTGVRSLGRTIQEKSRPMRDLSMNVRDDLLNHVQGTVNTDELIAIYSPVDAFYLLSFPTLDLAYCFDTKGMLQDGTFRVTTWSGVSHKAYSFDPLTDTIRVAQVNGIGELTGYSDNGIPYLFTYFTNHFDMGQPTATKILKKINLVLIGASNQVIRLKTGSDYLELYENYDLTLPTNNIALYGVSLYGTNPAVSAPRPALAQYSTGISITNMKTSVGGTGGTLQVGVETEINGALVSLQKLDILTKIGRTI